MVKTAVKTTKTTAARKTAPIKSNSVKSTPVNPNPAVPSKPSAIKAAAVKSATSAAPTPKIVSSSPTKEVNLEMKKKELIDKVVLRSGIKKKDAKPVVEAMLAILGETLGEGRELNLQPLGKMKINRMKQVAQNRIIICKLRQSMTPKTITAAPLAKPAKPF